MGAGTGRVCFSWKGGIGTSTRRAGSYTVGVLVQTNFGGNLTIDGVPVGRERGKKPEGAGDGSVIVVIATDAPVDARNLRRMAARSMLGLARTGSSASNGSGDYGIAFSTAREGKPLSNEDSLFRATTMTGRGRTVEALPIDKTPEILKKHGALR